MICRYCDQPIAEPDLAVTFGYWYAFEFRCHKLCKDAGVKQEAFDCQVIDADCNDCKHFKRGPLVAKNVFRGHCLKFDKPTLGCPKTWTGHGCFEHRRA